VHLPVVPIPQGRRCRVNPADRQAATRKIRIGSASTTVQQVVSCNRCGELDPPTDGTARRHAQAHPDHEVSMSRSVQVDYFAREVSDDA